MSQTCVCLQTPLLAWYAKTEPSPSFSTLATVYRMGVGDVDPPTAQPGDRQLPHCPSFLCSWQWKKESSVVNKNIFCVDGK